MEQVRAAALADRTAVGFAAAFAEDGQYELPDPEEAVRRFDAALTAESTADQLAHLDPETADLLIGLGLRR